MDIIPQQFLRINFSSLLITLLSKKVCKYPGDRIDKTEVRPEVVSNPESTVKL